MNGIQSISSTNFMMNMKSINNKNEKDPFLTDAAKVIGISYDDLKTLLESGEDLQTIIEEKGLSLEDFQKQMYTLFNSHQNANVDQVGNIVNETA
ncbi:hypothetical protein L7E55_02175 [Pelotomaculum isophthalicicum JI]|uniref:Uncharacterized protein n=1 Tax=Pelotomaculum isophthalicicum JI TaxID=947010 RepID=A0A9X4H3U8_9FIRM|nr:hypothetical protein [Pelotomaculum isophthalicicum]MDF9407172.1 hypothetical protein [Pelotomaculum isophthalicicum JI]